MPARLSGVSLSDDVGAVTLFLVMKFGSHGGKWKANTSSGEAITGGNTRLLVTKCCRFPFLTLSSSSSLTPPLRL